MITAMVTTISDDNRSVVLAKKMIITLTSKAIVVDFLLLYAHSCVVMVFVFMFVGLPYKTGNIVTRRP